MEYRTLINGMQIPMVGFGVYQVTDLKECEDVVYEALKVGYRFIDTAAIYKNEQAVGKAIQRAIQDGICKREDIIVTTKLWVQDMDCYESAAKAIDASLQRLNLDYIDVYLQHQAMNDVYGSWRAMEDAYANGKLKAIGVSNFYPERLMDLWLHAKIKPMINQVELHPFFAQNEAVKNMEALQVVPEAWGPFAEGAHGIFTHPLLTEIGKHYNKTPAQVALRWNIQRGVIVLPKSVHTDRIQQNFDVFDFSLTDVEMEEINTLNCSNYSEIVNHYDPQIVKMIEGVKLHD